MKPRGRSEAATKELVSWVYSQYAKMKSQRQFEQRKWAYALAMVDGNQYIQQQGRGSQATLGINRVPSYRARTVTNRLRPLVRTEQAFYTSQKPTATVTPASGEDEDIFAAQAAEQYWESTYERLNIKRMWVRNSFWFVTCGNAFVKTIWDPDVIVDDQESIYNLGGGQTVKAPSQGDIGISLVTPFHLFVPDLLESEIEDQPYVFQVYTKPLEWAKKFYSTNDLSPDVVAATEILDSIYFNANANHNAKPDSVLVIEAWVKPGSVGILPEGGLITVASQKIVGEYTGLPYTHGQYPFSHARTIETGKFYGASVLEDVIPLQREYNSTRNQIIESKRRMARPQIIAPRGSMDLTKLTSEPGAVHLYEPGMQKPEWIPGVPIPGYVLEELNRITSDMEDITGQHAPSRGSAPGSGVVAATAISFLQEKDDSLRATGFSSVEDLMEKVARQALSLFVDFVDIPRAIKVVGTDQAFNLIELKGSDIVSGLDLRIQGGSALPQSKQARQAMLMDLFTTGAISKEDLLSLLDMGGVQRLTDRLRIDRAEAQRENLRFKNLTDLEIQQWQMEAQMQSIQGENWQSDPNTGLPLAPPPIVPVQTWQNHAIHIDVHNTYRKGTEFDMLPDQTKQLFEQHVQLHQQAMMQQQMQAGMLGAPQSQGMPGIPPDMAQQDMTTAGAIAPPTATTSAGPVGGM
jgi:hypothetical protein